MKQPLFLLLFLFLGRLAFGAWLENVPQTITQPDGTVIRCFATGDEYYHWLHDKGGYTIVVNPADGYFYYGIRSGEDVIPSDHVVGRVDPAVAGLVRNARISASLYNSRRAQYNRSLKAVTDAPTSGQVNNISIYITFADDTAFAENHPRDFFFDFYSSDNGASLRDYFREVSYNHLFIDTYHFPLSPDSINVTYRDPNPRGYYLKKTAYNTIGYASGEEGEREHAMLKRAVEFVNDQLPEGISFDMNDDGNIDNICFVIQGAAAGWSDLLWPHRWSLSSQDARLGGKRVWDYLLMLEGGFSVGTLAHEFFHVLGSPDLYHYNDNGSPDPVGAWDVMCSNQDPPQYMSAFMKHKYGDWIASIPEITESGVYTLYPLQMTEQTVYRIRSPYSRQEYFTLEYRKKTGRYESSVPGTGLVIYRINPNAGNGNAGGPPDEVYVYRPGGSLGAVGTLSSAAFGAAGRKSFSDKTDPNCFLYNSGQGGRGGIDVSNISVYPDSVTFKVTITHLFPPTQLEMTPAEGWVNLVWAGSMVPGLTGYYVYRNGVRVDTTASTAYHDADIQTGRTYTYYVTAAYEGEHAGESEPSNEATYTPLGILSLPYEEDFEDNAHGWLIKGYEEGFRWGTAESLDMQATNESHFIAASSMAAGANTKCLDYAITPRLNLSGQDKVVLDFDYVLKRWQQLDHLKIFIRRNRSGEWKQIIDLPVSGIGAGYKWKSYSLELPQDELTESAQIAFRYDDGDGFGYAGAVDNVSIHATGSGTDPFTLENELELYPNPASGKAYIRFNLTGHPETTLRICDPGGKVLWTGKAFPGYGSTEELDLSHLASGHYYVLVSYSGKVIVKQLVIQSE